MSRFFKESLPLLFIYNPQNEMFQGYKTKRIIL